MWKLINVLKSLNSKIMKKNKFRKMEMIRGDQFTPDKETFLQ